MFLRDTVNEYGTPAAEFKCDTCGGIFTVCPRPENFNNWQNCLANECDSYDPKRDIEWMFPEDPKVTPITSPGRRKY